MSDAERWTNADGDPVDAPVFASELNDQATGPSPEDQPLTLVPDDGDRKEEEEEEPASLTYSCWYVFERMIEIIDAKDDDGEWHYLAEDRIAAGRLMLDARGLVDAQAMNNRMVEEKMRQNDLMSRAVAQQEQMAASGLFVPSGATFGPKL